MLDSKINSRSRLRQIIDFAGMKYKGGYPTDIDGFMEFDGRVFIYFDLKLKDTPLSLGQRLAYERLCSKTGGIAIIAEHEVYDTFIDIEAASCRVVQYYHNGHWSPPSKEITLKEGIDKYLKFKGVGKYIDG